MAIAEALVTAEEYRLLPDNGRPTELVRGRIVPVNMPAPLHGYLCNRVGRLLGNFVEEHGLGRVMNNDSGVVTGRNPDTVRGADVAYYSYAHLSRGPLPEGYLDVVPDLVFEVRSPGGRWSTIFAKVAEYLEAGIPVVCVLDSQSQTLTICRADQSPRQLTADQEFALPERLGDFRVPVRRFLE